MTGLRVTDEGKDKGGCSGNRNSRDLLGGELVADDFQKAFDFFDGSLGAEREGDAVFAFLDGGGFVGFDSLTAEFGAELWCGVGEGEDGEAAVFFLYDGCAHSVFLGFPAGNIA